MEEGKKVELLIQKNYWIGGADGVRGAGTGFDMGIKLTFSKSK